MVSRLLRSLWFLALAVAVWAQAWEGAPRIVAVGDVHGDFAQFTAVLRSAGVIDKKHKWTGGKTHLVQTGDVPDRGPDTRKIVDLLMKLEKQALKAGGMVHCLIGNHETMNIIGDLRYTTAEEFAAFRDSSSEAVRSRFYELHVEELKQQGKPEPDEAYRRSWEADRPLGWFEHRYQFGSNGKYFKWIAAHNTVIRVNDTLFLHGGISPKYAEFELAGINDAVRSELSDPARWNDQAMIRDEEGPLWHRGLANGQEAGLSAHVDSLLARHHARRIVIGHTPTPGAVLSRFDGKVLLIDVGLSAAYGARLACLAIEGGTAYAIHRGKRIELPRDSGDDYLRYLKEAAALDPKPSPLEPLIQEAGSKMPAAAK